MKKQVKSWLNVPHSRIDEASIAEACGWGKCVRLHEWHERHALINANDCASSCSTFTVTIKGATYQFLMVQELRT